MSNNLFNITWDNMVYGFETEESRIMRMWGQALDSFIPGEQVLIRSKEYVMNHGGEIEKRLSFNPPTKLKDIAIGLLHNSSYYNIWLLSVDDDLDGIWRFRLVGRSAPVDTRVLNYVNRMFLEKRLRL